MHPAVLEHVICTIDAHLASRRTFYAANREKFAAAARELRQRDHAATLKKDAALRARHKDKNVAYRKSLEGRAAAKLWRENNNERLLAKQRALYPEKREKILAIMRASVAKRKLEDPEGVKARKKAVSRRYYEKNRDACLARSKAGKKTRKKTPETRLARRCRHRMWECLNGVKKLDHTRKLVGCSYAFLRAHLESQFYAGMSWENYGKLWHIDHERPVASFCLSDPEQQEECFHWTNLRPLLAMDNILKSDKVLPHDQGEPILIERWNKITRK